MSGFTDNMRLMANITSSENGGRVFKSTNGGALLDLYSLIGGMRHQPESEIRTKWKEAYNESPILASNLVLYARDIRNGGLGERKIGRVLLNELAKVEPELIKRNFQTVVDCGRWDDLWFAFEGTSVEPYMWDFIIATLANDIDQMSEKKQCTLLAKWMPSINTSSIQTRRIAKKFCFLIGVNEKTYRKALSALRSYLNVVEVKMSAGQWDSIDFETIPSVAMSKYVGTFNRRLKEKFSDYKAKAAKGEAKVHAATLTPATICHKFLMNGGMRVWSEHWGSCQEAANILDEMDKLQWNNLPNYVEGNQDVVIMADISGSMSCSNSEPLAASVGLATYFAQRNTGAYKNLYMTFAGQPRFIELNDSWDIEKCFSYALQQPAGYNTNMDAAFKAVYDVAVESGEAPRAICVISDGEMDGWVTSSIADSIVSKWNNKFIEAGLNPVKVISWNVAARNGTVLAPANHDIAYCSGSSAGSFKNFTSLISKDAYEAMVEILSKSEFTWK